MLQNYKRSFHPGLYVRVPAKDLAHLQKGGQLRTLANWLDVKPTGTGRAEVEWLPATCRGFHL